MIFKEQFPSIKLLAQPQIVESPFTDALGISYPYTEHGDWLHKEELQKYCLDKQKVIDVIAKLKHMNACGEYIQVAINVLEEELGLE